MDIPAYGKRSATHARRESATRHVAKRQRFIVIAGRPDERVLVGMDAHPRLRFGDGVGTPWTA